MCWRMRLLILLSVSRGKSPDKRYARIKAVFDFFAEKVGLESKKSLFNAVVKRKAHVILKFVSAVFLSDPPAIDLCIMKTNG
jgi:hypothetical protein